MSAAALGASLACGAPDVDAPPAPDMSALVDEYEHPSADFDPSAAPDVLAAVAVFDALLAQTDLRVQLVDVLGQVIDQADDISSDGEGAFDLSIEADGYLRVTRICSGWDDVPSPDAEQNGTLRVTATVSGSGLDPIVWGSAAACRYRVGESRVQLDSSDAGEGGINVYWGRSVEREALDERALLVELNMLAEIDGANLLLDFDFRSLTDGRIEYRLEQASGALIALVDDAAERVTVRAANGTFECDTTLECRPAPAEDP